VCDIDNLLFFIRDIIARYGKIHSEHSIIPKHQDGASALPFGYTQPPPHMYGIGYGFPPSMIPPFNYSQPLFMPRNLSPLHQDSQPYFTPSNLPPFMPSHSIARSSGLIPSRPALGSAIQMGEANRTIYLGNVSESITPHDILIRVHCGMIEAYRSVPERNCAFINFVDPAAARIFYQEYISKALVINGTRIQVGWGNVSVLSKTVALQIEGGATRNVYLGNLTPKDTEETIKKDLTKFGQIEHIRLVRSLNVAFIHFLNIQSACKCVTNLELDEAWKEKRIGYGKDHCADLAEQYNKALENSTGFSNPDAKLLSFFDPQGIPYPVKSVVSAPPLSNVRRTIYVGNIHQDATTEDLCNVFRGGNLLEVRFLKYRNTAFMTFMDEPTAEKIFEHAQAIGIQIRGRKLRLGWGKPTSISPQIAVAIQNGATRNIYVGNIDPQVMTTARLKADFSHFGDIELVNIHEEKKCAFINFTNVKSAVTAITGIRLNEDYADLKISYGKDRCGNDWKPVKVKAEKKDDKKDDKKENNKEDNSH
jgi:RNA recognition motif-containing protein